MRKKILTARNCITALLIILIAISLAIGLRSVMPVTVYADDEVTYSVNAWQYYDGDINADYDENNWTDMPDGGFSFDGVDKFAYIRASINVNADIHIIYAQGCDPDYLEEHDIGLYVTFEVRDEDGVYNPVKSLMLVGDYRAKIDGIGNVKNAEIDFSISKALDNDWQTEPSIKGWEYGNFDNSINAVPKYILPDENVTFSVTTDEAGEEYVSDALKSFTNPALISGLNQGTYYITITLAETDCYDGLETTLSFTVRKTENSWVETSGSEWKYGEFSADGSSLVIANAKFGSASFSLYSENPETNPEAKSLLVFETDDKGILKSANRTVTVGNYSGSLGGFFETLSAGTYYVVATIADDENGNYDGIKSGVLQIKVSTVENDWIITPSLAGWNWGSFDKEKNKISFKAIIGNETAYFYIYSDTSEDNWHESILEYSQSITVNGGSNNRFFKLEQDGSIPDYVAKKLNSLDSGIYYLQCVIPGTDNYSGLPVYGGPETGHPFYVYAIDNAITKLTISQWAWGEFNFFNNTVSVATAHGDINNITYTIYSDDGGEIGEAVNLKLTDFRVYADGTVYEGVRTALGALDAGDYWLVAQTNDQNKNFNDVSTAIKFSVIKQSNYWTTTPYIHQWVWSDYNSEVNIISGEARWNDSGDIWYGIFTKETCETADAINATLSAFRLDENGLVPDYVADELGKLEAATYYLKGWIKNGSDNYEDLTARVPFFVNKIRNTWTTSPYILDWKYGEYQSDFNVIKGEAKFGAVTQFSIYTDEACTQAVTFNGSTSFILGADGLVPEEVAEVLGLLAVGKYYLIASVESVEGKYFGINIGETREPVPFEIRALENYWIDAPGLISWSEGHFSADANIFSGEAKVGNVTYTISNANDIALYIIVKENGEIVSVKKANGETAELDDLNKLPVGYYKLKAVVAASDNYSNLETTAYFSVFEDSVGLSGIIAAVITFAVLDVLAAGACIALLIMRRRKIEKQYRKMIEKELHRR